jgi:hypothetical protein
MVSDMPVASCNNNGMNATFKNGVSGGQLDRLSSLSAKGCPCAESKSQSVQWLLTTLVHRHRSGPDCVEEGLSHHKASRLLGLPPLVK